MPALGGRSGLTATVAVTVQTDAELARILNLAAKDIERLINTAGVGAVRRAQYQAALAQVQGRMHELWSAGVGPGVEAGVRRAADAAADTAYSSLAAYAARGGVTLDEESLRVQARGGLASLKSRGVNGVPLSQRVYNGEVDSSSAIARVVNTGLVAGSSAREIARAARALIDPGVPGGVSYSAMRLGRTEINNAFHATSIRLNSKNPFVEAMDWKLSGSHPRTDQCDTLASDGPYEPQEVPAKPHPQCFCYTIPIVPDEDEFIRRYAAGEYDSFLNESSADGLRYEDTQRERKAEILQRRVLLEPGPQGGLRSSALVDLTPAQRARFLTAEERSLLRK